MEIWKCVPFFAMYNDDLMLNGIRITSFLFVHVHVSADLCWVATYVFVNSDVTWSTLLVFLSSPIYPFSVLHIWLWDQMNSGCNLKAAALSGSHEIQQPVSLCSVLETRPHLAAATSHALWSNDGSKAWERSVKGAEWWTDWCLMFEV